MQDAVTRISLRYLKEARILNFECIVGFVIRRGLYSDYDLVHKWTGILIASKKHIRILEQLVYDHVAQGMIVLVQGGNCCIWNFCVLLPGHLLLTIKKEKRLKGRRGIHDHGYYHKSELVTLHLVHKFLFLQEHSRNRPGYAEILVQSAVSQERVSR